MSLTIGELFAGFGGLGMGIQEVFDAEVAWVSEVDKHANKVLAQRFPNVPNHGDITKIDWRAVQPVDILCGGSPCQDLSHAGQLMGMRAGTRSGLWVNMLEAIKQLQPKLVVWENVRGALSAGADSAMEPCPRCMGDGTEKLVLRALGRVLGDLATAGYDAEWHTLRAADIGAPHNRLRVFVVAWPRATGKPRLDGKTFAQRNEPRTTGLRVTRFDDSYGLFPTPAVNDMGAGKEVEAWDNWAANQKSATGKPAPHGKSLSIEALRLLATPQARDFKGVPGNNFNLASLPRDVSKLKLLRTPCADETGGGPLHPEVATAKNQTLRLTGQVLAATGNLAAPDGSKKYSWGEYTPAINRWETIFGQPAPVPVLPTARTGANQLSAEFVEWLMGIPKGFITETSVPRSAQIKMLGNGVVPQQAAEALRRALS